MSAPIGPYPVAMHPGIGKAKQVGPGHVVVKLSTRKRTQAPGYLVAQALARPLLPDADYTRLATAIVAQGDGWLLWSVRA